MAGYVTKHNGHIYEGGYVAAEVLHNGDFAEILPSGEVVKNASEKDTALRFIEKTVLWGKDAYILNVISVGEDEAYFVENEWEERGNATFDDAEYAVKPGELVRMKRLLPGEQIILTICEGQPPLSPAQLCKPQADGILA